MKRILACAGMLAACLSPAKAWAEDAIVLYGGLTYVDESSTPEMAAFLRSDAQGAYLEQGNLLLDHTEDLVARLASEGRFSSLSDAPVIMTHDQAWERALAAGAEGRQEGRLSEELELRYDRVYGLVLLGAFENVVEQEFPVTDARTRERVMTYKNTYMVGVDALLVEFDSATSTMPIRLASSAFTTVDDATASPGGQNVSSRAMHFRQAYLEAIEESLVRLDTVSKRAGLDGDDESYEGAFMVTGFAIQDDTAASVLGYDFTKKPAGSDLRANMCRVPSGCLPGNEDCRKLAALAMHGVTASFSEAGFSVMPPLSSEYVNDPGRAISVNLSIHSDEESLLSGRGDVKISEVDAANKLVVVLRDIGFEDRAHSDPALASFTSVRAYVSSLGYVRAATGFDGCTPVGSLSTEQYPTSAVGCAAESFVHSQGAPTADTDRDLYALSVMNKLEHMAQDMTGRSRGARTCYGLSQGSGGQ